MKLLLSVILFSLSTLVAAQTNRLSIDEVMGNNPTYGQPGSLKLIVEPGIDELLRRYKEENKSKPQIDGFRVQLYFGTREKATEIKTEFLKNYPTTKSYISYLAPNFKVRVGNFRTQLSAEAFLVKIRKTFPSAYIVADKIDLPDID